MYYKNDICWTKKNEQCKMAGKCEYENERLWNVNKEEEKNGRNEYKMWRLSRTKHWFDVTSALNDEN